MWQYLIPVVVRFLLQKVASNLPTEQWKQQAKIWVKDTVPGSWFDDAAWAVVEGAWDLILSEISAQIPNGVHDRSPMGDVWKAVSHVSAKVMADTQDKLSDEAQKAKGWTGGLNPFVR